MRTNQGGSVVSFLVVGVIFVAIIMGAVYALQHRSGGSATTSTKSPSVAVTSKTPAASSSQAPAPSRSASPAPSSAPKAGYDGQQSSNNPVATNSTPETMPATGPSDILPGGIAIAVLIGMTVAFAQSVKARRQLSV